MNKMERGCPYSYCYFHVAKQLGKESFGRSSSATIGVTAATLVIPPPSTQFICCLLVELMVHVFSFRFVARTTQVGHILQRYLFCLLPLVPQLNGFPSRRSSSTTAALKLSTPKKHCPASTGTKLSTTPTIAPSPGQTNKSTNAARASLK